MLLRKLALADAAADVFRSYLYPVGLRGLFNRLSPLFTHHPLHTATYLLFQLLRVFLLPSLDFLLRIQGNIDACVPFYELLEKLCPLLQGDYQQA